MGCVVVYDTVPSDPRHKDGSIPLHTAIERALEEIDDFDVCILLGLMPLRSARQAEFLHYEVPGINIPRSVRDKLAELSAKEAVKYGVEVTQNLLVKARPLVRGAYIMPPASAPDLAGEVIEAIS
jgi:methionine synthase / methylenetetrahydrofolate reductase(NADPH)